VNKICNEGSNEPQTFGASRDKIVELVDNASPLEAVHGSSYRSKRKITHAREIDDVFSARSF
jgi:hypothetical protein